MLIPLVVSIERDGFLIYKSHDEIVLYKNTHISLRHKSYETISYKNFEWNPHVIQEFSLVGKVIECLLLTKCPQTSKSIDDVTKFNPLIHNRCMRFYEFHGRVIKE